MENFTEHCDFKLIFLVSDSAKKCFGAMDIIKIVKTPNVRHNLGLPILYSV